MLSKLLKHEFRATGRILLPVYLLVLMTSGLCRLFLYLSKLYDDVQAITVFQSLTLAAYVISAFGAAVLTVALVIYRFYKNFMTDEGYLMFTLPASTGQLLCSKMIAALIWSLATLFIEAGGFFLATLDYIPWMEGFRQGMLFIRIMQIPAGEIVGCAALCLCVLLGVLVSTYLVFYASIATGHSFANRKIFLSVVFYFVFTLVLQIVSAFGGLSAVSLVPHDLFANGDNLALSLRLVSYAVLSWSVVISVIFYLVTYLMLKRKLNLQ